MRKTIFFAIFLLVGLFYPSFLTAKEVILPTKEEMNKMTVDELLTLAYSVTEEDFPASIKVINIALAKAKSDNQVNKIVDCHRAKGFLYEDKNTFDKAIEEYNAALEVCKNDSVKYTIGLYNDIAIVYRKVKNYQKSKEYHHLTLELAQKVNNLDGIEFAYDGLGALYFIAGDYDKAADFYLKSLDISEKSNNSTNVIITLKNLTEIYGAAKHYNLALQNIERAYRLADKAKDKDAFVRVGISYANCLYQMGDYEKAIKKINESLSVIQGDNDLVESKISAYFTLGGIYFKQKDYKKAAEIFELCLKDKMSMSRANLAELNVHLGDIEEQKANYHKALSLYKDGLSIAIEYKDLQWIAKAHNGLHKVYRQMNQPEKALFHLENANIIKDSLNQEDKIKRVAELQFRYDLKNAELQFRYDLKNSESQIQNLKHRQDQISLYSTLGIAIILISFLGYIVWLRGANNQSLINKNKEIEQQNKRLAESNDALRQFAYASAHDLKEPLRNIGSFITLIQRKYGKMLPEECNEYMGYVTGGTKKMNNLLEDLLAYSTLIMSNEKEKETSKVSEVVVEIEQNMKATIASKNATIICNHKVNNLIMSKLHATQLLQNLISNGIKFVNDKAPVIQITTTEQSNNKVLLTVEDNGIGIKNEYKDKVFQLFQRLHKNDERYEGTGVGLAICKNIVEKYNGDIWLESEENKGTKFFILLPKIAA
jgi:signal transduction histidine kinase